MEDFCDKNISIFCPKCSRLIDVILFHFNNLNSKQNLYFEYFCNSCYEFSLKQKNENNSNNTNKKEKEKQTLEDKEKIIRENKESISNKLFKAIFL